MRENRVAGVVFDDFVFEIIPTDLGDAVERLAAGQRSGYPTTRTNGGALHLNTNLEWLGRFGAANDTSVSPEQDAADEPTDRIYDPDGLNNLDLAGPGFDRDRYDDGVTFFPLTYAAGGRGRAEFNVCVADRDTGRYANNDDRLLYINAWIDWNTNEIWEDAPEHIINGLRLEPALNAATGQAWNIRGIRNPATTITQRLTSISGRCARFRAEFDVPAQIGKGELWSRFRVDFGEDVGRNDPRPLFVPDPSAASASTTLADKTMRFGEVEDYLIATDFGDAQDPYNPPNQGQYPSRKSSQGARHLDKPRMAGQTRHHYRCLA